MMPRFLLAITTQLILFCVPAMAPAQDAPDAPQSARRGGRRGGPPAPMTIEVFKLKYAVCYEIRDVLNNSIHDAKCSFDERTNSVIYAGSAASVQEAQRLVEALDVPADETSEEEVFMVRLKHRDAEDVARQIATTLAGSDIRVSADSALATVIMQGPRAAISGAQRIVSQLDSAPTTVNLELAFFHADINDDGTDAIIPPDLAEVAKELKRFGGLELLGRMSTIAVEGEKFQIQGAIAGDVDVATQVEGVLAGTVGDAIKIRLNARLKMESSGGGGEQGKTERRSRRPVFEIETAVTTEPGAYVVLGSAPTGWGPGESAILVLHIRPKTVGTPRP